MNARNIARQVFFFDRGGVLSMVWRNEWTMVVDDTKESRLSLTKHRVVLLKVLLTLKRD